MERNWDRFVDIYGNIQGAREAFEQACETIFRNQYSKKAQQIRTAKGDEGIDIMIGDLSEESIEVIQCKFFIHDFGDSQIGQIKRSFERAYRNDKYELSKWILAVPRTFTFEEKELWSRWKKKTINKFGLQTNFIELIDGGELIDLLKAIGRYNQVFKLEDSMKINSIYEEIVVNKKTYNDSEIEIKGASDLNNITDFFKRTRLIFDKKIKYDIGRVLFEIASNSFMHGNANWVKIKIENDKIFFSDNGLPFNSLDQEIKPDFRAGLRFVKSILRIYEQNSSWVYSYSAGRNIIEIQFDGNFSASNLIDPCSFIIEGNPTRVFSWSDHLKIVDGCSIVTLDLRKAWFNPSNIYDFLDYLLKVSRNKEFDIELLIDDDDTIKEVIKEWIHAGHFSKLREKIIIR